MYTLEEQQHMLWQGITLCFHVTALSELGQERSWLGNYIDQADLQLSY